MVDEAKTKTSVPDFAPCSLTELGINEEKALDEINNKLIQEEKNRFCYRLFDNSAENNFVPILKRSCKIFTAGIAALILLSLFLLLLKMTADGSLNFVNHEQHEHHGGMKRGPG